ncbi:MAG: hypothetical protein U9O98_06560, partial [Asgard group archaeon]|nr:hypothetical protein [Asgard group archaeon]
MNTDFFISTSIAVLFLLLFALMLFQSIKKHRRAFILTASLLVGTFGGVISALQYVISAYEKYFLYFSLIIWSITYFMIYIFLEKLYSPKPNRIRLAIISVFLFSSIVFQLLTLLAPDAGTVDPSNVFRTLYANFTNGIIWGMDISYTLLGSSIFIFGAYVHYKAYMFNKEPVILIQVISTAIIALGFFVGFIGGDIFKISVFLAIGDGI